MNHVRSRIHRAAMAAGRDPESVTLVAVSKAKTAESVRLAATAGVTDFGENYLQEALVKMDQIADLKLRGVSVDEASRMITTYDIRWACDVFRPVYERTGGLDGRVSLEVDPRLANETEKTTAEARALWWIVDRPNHSARDRKSTRLNSSHIQKSRMPSSA